MSNKTDSEIIDLIFQVSRSMKEEMNIPTSFVEISQIQLLTLFFISSSSKKVQMKDIAKHFSVEMPTATSMLDKLVKAGLVKRVEDKNDRRIVVVYLTSKGETVLKEAMKIRAGKIKKLLGFLSETQKESFRNILETLSKIKNMKVEAKVKVKI